MACTVNVIRFTISSISQSRAKIFTGLFIPESMGPMTVAPPSLLKSLYAIFPEVRSGKIRTFAASFRLENS